MMMMIEKDMWMKTEIAIFMVWVVGTTCDIQWFLNDTILIPRHVQYSRYWKREHFSAIEQLKTLLQEHHPNENISVRTSLWYTDDDDGNLLWWLSSWSSRSSPSRCLKPLSAGSSTTLRWTDLTETRLSSAPPELNRFFHIPFLDALASLDLKFSLGQWLIFFRISS